MLCILVNLSLIQPESKGKSNVIKDSTTLKGKHIPSDNQLSSNLNLNFKCIIMPSHNGENDEGLRKIIDMTRIISVALLILHFYYYCYAAFHQWNSTAGNN